MRIPPKGWAADGLTEFLETARQNQFATFANFEDQMLDLKTVDDITRRSLEGRRDPNPLLPAIFLLRAHSSLRSAAGLVMAGQLYDANSIFRNCLEACGYAIFIGTDAARGERWVRRHDSIETRKAVRSEFTAKAVDAAISAGSEKLGDIYRKLYEDAIDYGAHPNERGFTLNMIIERKPNERKISQVYLSSDSRHISFLLQRTIQIGIFIIRAIDLLFPTFINDEDRTKLANLVVRY